MRRTRPRGTRLLVAGLSSEVSTLTTPLLSRIRGSASTRTFAEYPRRHCPHTRRAEATCGIDRANDDHAVCVIDIAARPGGSRRRNPPGVRQGILLPTPPSADRAAEQQDGAVGSTLSGWQRRRGVWRFGRGNGRGRGRARTWRRNRVRGRGYRLRGYRRGRRRFWHWRCCHSTPLTRGRRRKSPALPGGSRGRSQVMPAGVKPASATHSPPSAFTVTAGKITRSVLVF